LLPSVDFSADANRQQAQVTGAGHETFNTFNPELSASYELDFWGKNRALRASARATAMPATMTRRRWHSQSLSSVASTYFQALEFRDRLEVADQNLTNGQKILHGLQLEQTAGIATALDVAQQETTVALLDAAIPPLQQQLRQIVQCAGRTARQNAGIDRCRYRNLEFPEESAVAPGLPSQLLSRRPDVAESEQQLVSANATSPLRAPHCPEYCTDRERRLRKFGTELAHQSGGPHLVVVRRSYPADISRRRASRSGGVQQRALCELLSAYHKAVISAFSNVENALVAPANQGAADQTAKGGRHCARVSVCQTQMSAGPSTY